MMGACRLRPGFVWHLQAHALLAADVASLCLAGKRAQHRAVAGRGHGGGEAAGGDAVQPGEQGRLPHVRLLSAGAAAVGFIGRGRGWQRWCAAWRARTPASCAAPDPTAAAATAAAAPTGAALSPHHSLVRCSCWSSAGLLLAAAAAATRMQRLQHLPPGLPGPGPWMSGKMDDRFPRRAAAAPAHASACCAPPSSKARARRGSAAS